MKYKARYPLFFEAYNGTVSASLPFEAWEALMQAPCCLPWSSGGTRGLIYYSAFKFEQAERELQATLKDAPLIAHLFNRVMYLNEMDDSGLFRIPRAAAHFAQIHDRAVLFQLANGRLLLLSEEQEQALHSTRTSRADITPFPCSR